MDYNKWKKSLTLPMLYLHAFNLDKKGNIVDYKINEVKNSNMFYYYVKLFKKELDEYLKIDNDKNPRDYVKFAKSIVGLSI
jgi:hypothetical protein